MEKAIVLDRSERYVSFLTYVRRSAYSAYVHKEPLSLHLQKNILRYYGHSTPPPSVRAPCLLIISTANSSEKLITINLRLSIFNLWLILILILATLAKFGWVYGTHLLTGHVKCPNKQVGTADWQISSFCVVTTYYWVAEKWDLLVEVCQHWF